MFFHSATGGYLAGMKLFTKAMIADEYNMLAYESDILAQVKIQDANLPYGDVSYSLKNVSCRGTLQSILKTD